MWRSKIKNLAAALLFIGTMVATGSSYALTLVGPTYDATGVDGLVVGGQTYDVTFVHEAYDTIFGCGSGNPPTCTTYPTFYGNVTGAEVAATDLATALDNLKVTGVSGINGQPTQNLLIPYGFDTYYGAGQNQKDSFCPTSYPYCFSSAASGSWIYVGTELDDVNFPNSPSAQNDYVLFAATPVPAALPLFAAGLSALGLLGWRRKRKARGHVT